MNIKIQDPPSRTQTFVRNTYYVIRGLAAMTVYFFRTFPLAFFYVLLVVTLYCEMNNIPLKGIFQKGMLIKLSAYALQANVLWLGVKVSMNSDELF
ncbi:hypothetical protein N6B35_28735 (plasmid) [Klebsiella michiganensis]|uniref:hypothetical protein n=1 Tax=Klebsiella michiganensis TaxID=1134687 RepID=UPI0021DA9531|nr:hypothetical protein [Klebsiella michiganensis]UYB60174.1 hypothetical protein N6B35_28735 [Klebsiella michiganensis]